MTYKSSVNRVAVTMLVLLSSGSTFAQFQCFKTEFLELQSMSKAKLNKLYCEHGEVIGSLIKELSSTSNSTKIQSEMSVCINELKRINDMSEKKFKTRFADKDCK